jgi:hypothetical protein
MRSRRRHIQGDTTRNFKRTQLLVTWPTGSRTIKRIIHGRKEVRVAIEQYLRAGATVTEQTPGEWGIYETVRVHEPAQQRETTS